MSAAAKTATTEFDHYFCTDDRDPTMKIVFIVPYPPRHSPSQRFRFEQYLPLINKAGHEYEIHSFLTAVNWRLFTKRGHVGSKITAIVNGLLRRIRLLFRINRFDWVFIHREALPLGPPIIEWLIARGLRKKIIFDFDDAIWLTDRANESALARMFRWRSKVATICRMSRRVSCGNAYLADFARRHNEDVIINPTTIDVSIHAVVKPQPASTEITIGWTGSLSTLKYLERLRGPIEIVLTRHPNVKFSVIADERPSFDWPTFSFIKWSIENEITDLMKFDIGIMPLPDDDWSKGKCGFKALQYMALGIPAVASPVGVNREIITHGVNGLLATSDDDWVECLETLIRDRDLAGKIGLSGRQRVLENYSVASNAGLVLSLFT